MTRQGKKTTTIHPHSIFLKLPALRWRIRNQGDMERERVVACERVCERESWLVKNFKEIGECSPLCVGLLRQVLYNVLGVIKSSVRLTQAEQEAADCRARAAAEREGGLPEP